MRFVEALLLLIIVAGGCWAIHALVTAAFGRRELWRCVEHTQPDGSILVEVRRAGEAPRKIGRPIRPTNDSVDTVSALRLLREEGEAIASELNRRGS